MTTEKTASAPFGTACYGRSAQGRCKVKTGWITTQSRGANPIYACGRHLTWLIALRTVPGESITVTRMPKAENAASQEVDR